MLQAMVTALRPQVDLLLVLSHVGHEEEQALARDIAGIDIIIGGHSHTTVLPPIKVGNTYVAQAGYYGAYVGKIELTVDTETDSMTAFSGTLIPAADLPAPDKKVARIVKRWEKKVARLVDFKISNADRDYTKSEMQPFLQKVLADATGADFGYYNMGGIRDTFRQGPVTARHIWQIEPFSNQLMVVTAKGSVIKYMLQSEEAQAERAASLNDDKIYRVATSDFIAAQAQKSVGDAVQIENQSMLIRDLLIDYIKAHGLEIE
ncbi:MAG: 2',3'-cyclic-nucleotide 2'-phosphodiesterase (5'-nucleotidase family) [Candidatus Azotimanducaceae bacterium]|jgi:2',3'-cyclic-nucleotide 2'-phosphodiesterase (5'-nucleotidase family)